MKFEISKTGCDPASIPDDGNRFLIGNGYMGVRGTLEEFTKKELAAVNLAGIYDQADDGWREPLNAPNPFYTVVSVNGGALRVQDFPPAEHEQRLDFRYGLASRKTVWNLAKGRLTLRAERFASMDNSHLLGLKITLCANADMRVKLEAGIDADVWDIHGPHYSSVKFGEKDGVLICEAAVQSGGTVAVSRNFSLPPDEFMRGTAIYLPELKAGVEFSLSSVCAVYTSKDLQNPAEAAQKSCAGSYENLLKASKARWDEIWDCSLVEIEGDEEAELAMNYSLYHLNCVAPRGGGAVSIAARGLSGQTYKGAVFWDSEIFMLDYFLASQPEIARSLLRYRIETLPGALKKAASYGWEGAFYAWESQEGGFDACSDYNITDVFTERPVRTYFKDKQAHISAAVVWGIMRYIERTGDLSLLKEGGARVIAECARFYKSLLVMPNARKRWEIHDVVGPDEYHERVNNNAYTNRMALFVFDALEKISEILQEDEKLERECGIAALLEEIRPLRENFYMPKPGESGLIEQFDGYFSLEDASLAEARSRLKDPREYWGGSHGVAGDTQIIKQADVATMLAMFPQDYPEEILRRNWEFYEPRTEHGSSLSACMYALLACRFGNAEAAYPFFMKSACAELRGGGKQWAGLVYIGGTHPAAAGGAWKVLAQGFAGLEYSDGKPSLRPCPPRHWKRLRLRFIHEGQIMLADITPGKAELKSK
ncbi:MAG: glycoside hydrolase family 65 protein [Oscillospiraceae bacterium]|nr:glycoside hydrolase family 65 protein [Oscillospiraceae bacterium]